MRRDRSGRAETHQSVGGGESQRMSTCTGQGGPKSCCRDRDDEHLVVVVVLSQPTAVVLHQSSPLPLGGPHYDSNRRDDNRKPGVAALATRQPGDQRQPQGSRGWQVRQQSKRGTGTAGATNNRVAPLGDESEGSGDERLSTSKEKTKGNGSAGWEVSVSRGEGNRGRPAIVERKWSLQTLTVAGPAVMNLNR